MSMYKNIFVNENADQSASVQIQGIDGSISNFGEGFSSVEAALAAVTAENSNAVIRVVSGKYDGYKVVTDGVESEPATVVAVNFGGGEVANEVTLADTGFSAAQQLSVIDDLNAANAAGGKVFVVAGDNVNADAALVVGVSSDGSQYVVSSAVTETDISDLIQIVEGVVPSKRIVVDNTISANIEGKQYKTYAEALAYVQENNAYDSTIVLSKTPTDSINNTTTADYNHYDIGFEVKEGATFFLGGNSIKMKKDFVVEAGAVLIGQRDSLNQVQVDGGSFVIGEAGDNKNIAKVDFTRDTPGRGYSLIVKENSSLVANNAEIKTFDMTTNGAAVFNDTNVNVNGTLAFGWDRSDDEGNFYAAEDVKLSNSDFTVSGNKKYDSSYYQSTNLLNNLVMEDGSTITFGTAEAGSANVLMKDVTMVDGSQVTVNGGQIILGTEDGEVGSDIITLDGEGTKLASIWNEGTVSGQKSAVLNVLNGAEVYASSTVKIAGTANVDASTVKSTNIGVYGENADQIAEMYLTNGATLAASGTLKLVHDSNTDRVGVLSVDNSTVTAGQVLIGAGSSIEVANGGKFGGTADKKMTVTGVDKGTWGTGFWAYDSTVENVDFNNQTVLFDGGTVVKDVTVTGGSAFFGYGGGSSEAVVIQGTVDTTKAEWKENYTGAGNYGTLKVAEGATFKTNYYGDTAANGNTIIDGTFEAATFRSYNGAVNEGGLLKASGAVNIYGTQPGKEASVYTVKGDINVSATDANAYNFKLGYEGGDYQGTGNVIMNVEGGSITVGSAEKSAYSYIAKDANGVQAQLNLTDGASFVTIGTLENNGIITVTDATITAGEITGSGTISLTVTAEMLNSLTGDFVLLEQTGNAAALDLSVSIAGKSYKVGDTFENNGIKFQISDGVGDNDIILDMTIDQVYVNSAFNENNAGGFVWGVNAFDSISDAIASGHKNIVVQSDITDSISSLGGIAISTDKADGVTITNTYADWVYFNTNASIGENVILNNDAESGFFAYGNTVINGDVVAYAPYTRYAGTLTVGTTGSLTFSEQFVIRYSDNDTEVPLINIVGNAEVGAAAEDRTAQLNSNRGYMTFYSGTINATDTLVNGGHLLMTQTTDANYSDTPAVINLDNTIWNFASNDSNAANLDGKAVINATNKSVLNFADDLILNGKDTAVNLTDSTLNVARGGVTNNGTINITDSTFKAGKVDNDNLFYIDGESTVQIDDATGSSYALRVKDGATLNDSYIKAKDNATLRMLGSMTVNGGLSAAYLQGASAEQGGVGGTFKIADDSTINVSYGVEFSNDYTLDGGKIVLSGGNTSNKFWGFVFQNGSFDINTDIEIKGNGTAVPLHFTNANAVVRSDISQSNSGGEVIYLKNSAVEVAGGSLSSTAGLHVNGNSSLVVDGGSIDSNISINSGWAYFNDADVTAKSIHNEQTIIVGGDTNMAFDKISASSKTANGVSVSGKPETYLSRFMVGFAPQDNQDGLGVNGNGLMAEPEEWTNLTLDSVSKKGITIDTFRAAFFNTNLTVKDDLTINIKDNTTYGNSYVQFGGKIDGEYAQLDLGGKTMTVNGQLNIGNADIKNGELVIDAKNGQSNVNCVTFATNTSDTDYLAIAEDAKVTVKSASGFNMYADKVVIEGQVTADAISHMNIGSAKDAWNSAPDGTQLIVSGNGALLDIKSVSSHVTIHGLANSQETNANSSLTIEDGAEVSFGGALTNNGVINTDENTVLSAGSIVNAGKFNSDVDGKAVINGSVNVTGNFKTADLTLAYGAALSAGSITVTNLTLTIGSTLTLGEGNSSAANITVVGDFNPENAEFILVATNFGKITGHNGTIFYDKDADGIVDDGETYTIGTKGDGNIVFKTDEAGNLIAKIENADIKAVYIGELPAGAVAGDKITVTDSDGNKATFTVGTDAFASATEAAGATGVDLSRLEEVHLGSGDHVDQISGNSQFDSVTDIIIDKNAVIQDANGDHNADFGSRSLNIDNAGHLEANIKTTGKIDMVNSSRNTYFGSMEAGDFALTNTGVYGDKTGNVQSTITANDVAIYQSADAELWNTTITANNGGSVLLSDGIYSDVDVKAGVLNLSSVDELTLDADSVITDNVNLGIDANADQTGEAATLTLKGATVNQVTGGVDASGNATGKVVFDGSLLQNTTIEDVATVTLASGSHSFGTAADGREFYMDNLEIGAADLTWNFSDGDDALYNIGTPLNNDEGMIKVISTSDDAKLTFAQSGEYSLGNFDVSGFGADVKVNSGAELTLKETTDYFADSADLAVEGILNLDGSANVAWDFDGAGAINVNDSHSFTAAGAIDGFTGTVTVADEKTLTLSAVNTTTAILAGSGDVVASADLTLNNTTAAQLDGFTGDIKADGATVTIKSSNNTSATFSGDGTLDIQAAQTLNAAKALDELAGTLNNASTITLTAGNTVQATLTGDGSIVATADQSFTGDVSAYTGSYTATGAAVTYTDASTLAGTMNLNGNGTFNISERTTAAEITINSDDSATNLNIFNNQVTLATGKFGDINGEAGAVIVDGTITAGDVNVADVTVNDDKTLAADSIAAGDLMVKGSVTAGSIDADNISIYVNTGAAIKVNGVNDFSDTAITVYNDSADFTSPYTLIDAENGSTYQATVKFDVNGTVESIDVNGVSVKIGDKFVQVYTEEGDLFIANFEIKNNVIYINSDWNAAVGTNVVWNGNQRIVGMDAAKTVEQAVEIVRGEDNNGVREAEIYVVKGDTYTTPAAMMTSTNGVQKLSLKADNQGVDGPLANGNEIGRGAAQLRGTVAAVEAGLTGSYEFELSNISTRANVLGGAEIKNGEAVASSTTLTIDGGNHMGSQVVAGNFITSAGDYAIDSSKIVIKNTTGATMSITGRVYGGSMLVGTGIAVAQDSAEIVIDSSSNGQISMRGDIYAAGSNGVAGNTLTVTNTKVTFTGDAANLVFTGRVSGGAAGETIGAIVADDNRFSELVFADFNGTFKGLIQDMDVITISGNSEVEFSRKQTLTADTDINFVLDGRTSTEAMFTVNKFGWTYGDTISVTTGSDFANDMNYTLIDVSDAGIDVSGFTFKLNGKNYSIGSEISVGNFNFSLSIAADGDLVLNVDKLVVDANNSVEDVYAKAGSGATIEVAADTVVDTNSWGKKVTYEVAEDTTFTLNQGDMNNNTSLTLNNGSVLTCGSDVNTNIKFNSGTFTLKEGADINASTNNLILRYAATMVAEGDNDIKVNMLENNKGKLSIGEDSSLYVNNYLNNSGTFTLTGVNDGVKNEYGVAQDGYGMYVQGQSANTISGGNFTLDDSTAKIAAGGLNITAGKVNLKNDSVLEVNGGMSVNGNNLTVASGSAVIADITGSANADTITVDVDGILNGTIDLASGSDTVTVTGFDTGLVGTKGAVAISGAVSNVENFRLGDSVDDALANAVQVLGGDTASTDDDVWAKLSQTTDGSLVVAWHNDATKIDSVLTEFENQTFEIGKAYLADTDSTTLSGMDHEDFTKKNNGTLA